MTPRIDSLALARWYEAVRRELPWRRRPTPYGVWVSEIMLQQTQVATVIPYFERFMKRFPDVHSLARARQDDVLALWSGLGYYRRARMLHAAARVMAETHGGEIPSSRRALLALPGVGRYTAGAILSIAFNEPEPLVDGNVERVFARLSARRGDTKSRLAQRAAWAFAESAMREAALQGVAPSVFNQALMELGATVCIPGRPRCAQCPLASQCRALKLGRQDRLPRPVRQPKAGLRRYRAWLMKDRRGRLLLIKRESGGASLLPAGLWELPHTPADAKHSGAALAVVRQAIMNWQVELEVRLAPRRALKGGRWFESGALAALPMASLTRKALKAAGYLGSTR
ncbi:MAG: A/G-specific adenine glycosylase [Planctomycetota bacterium]|nr:A/G-specific adenine glycosylase [Planctomycetota bacterium]GIK51822.1 MAG: A/G-specific adenine glycosylase [Planctomycetota bacterium]